MKSLAIILFVSGCTFARAREVIKVIPYPQHVKVDSGSNDLTNLSFFYTNLKDDFLINEFKQFADAFSSKVKFSHELQHSGLEVIIDSLLIDSLKEEGYLLKITPRKIRILAANKAGTFYGLQSLNQLASFNKNLPCLSISDQPKLEWRGSMIDIARSFFGVEYLKKHIDRMALYKLNRLHLHLTDDQGWRIEIKGWPRLTSQGSKSAVEGGGSGYLTQNEFIELQEYASQRNIVIIPEIDIPGHIYAALASYPELNCPEMENIDLSIQQPPAMYTGTKVGWSKLCLENPQTYVFVEDIINEMAAITQGSYLHMGGDEIADPLYPEFVLGVDTLIRNAGKIPIGWEEVLQGEVSPQLIGQVWHGKVDNKAGNKWINSACQNFYFDHGNYKDQPGTNNWCNKNGISLQEVYKQLPSDPDLIGVEAAVWTEFIHTEKRMDSMLWPRLAAVAEITWSEKHDLQGFSFRMGFHAPLLEQMSINFHRFEEIKWK